MNDTYSRSAASKLTIFLWLSSKDKNSKNKYQNRLHFSQKALFILSHSSFFPRLIWLCAKIGFDRINFFFTFWQNKTVLLDRICRTIWTFWQNFKKLNPKLFWQNKMFDQTLIYTQGQKSPLIKMVRHVGVGTTKWL